MKDLKKLMLLVLVFVVALSCTMISFAEEAEEDENTVVIGSPEEYEQLMQGEFGDSYYSDYSNSANSTANASEDDLKQYYLEYKEYLYDYYTSYERPELTKAIVTEAGYIKDEYEVTDYYSVTKYVVQDVKAKIIEGEYAGQEIEMDYLLSADSLNNILLAPLHVGDKIFVSLTEENGVLSGEISNSWSTVQRTTTMICIGAIIGILLLIYAGKKGLNAVLITLIVLLSCTIVVPIFIYKSISTIWISIFVAVVLIVALSMAHLGLTKNTLKAIGISACMSGMMMLLVVGMSYITRTVGTLFEYAAIAENVLLGNINFTQVYYMGILVAGAGMIANLVSASIAKIERECADNFNDKVRVCRDILLSNVVNVTLLFLVAYIPNHLLLITNKFTEQEIINSETLISELIRIFAIQIAMILTVPVLSLDTFKFGKKYLKEAETEKKE